MTVRQSQRARRIFRRYARLRERGKKCYASADQCAKALADVVKIGESFECDGQMVTLVDPFAEKDVVYGHGPVRKTEIVAKPIGKREEKER